MTHALTNILTSISDPQCQFVTFYFLQHKSSFKGTWYSRYSDWFTKTSAFFIIQKIWRIIFIFWCFFLLKRYQVKMYKSIDSNTITLSFVYILIIIIIIHNNNKLYIISRTKSTYSATKLLQTKRDLAKRDHIGHNKGHHDRVHKKLNTVTWVLFSFHFGIFYRI